MSEGNQKGSRGRQERSERERAWSWRKLFPEEKGKANTTAFIILQRSCPSEAKSKFLNMIPWKYLQWGPTNQLSIIPGKNPRVHGNKSCIRIAGSTPSIFSHHNSFISELSCSSHPHRHDLDFFQRELSISLPISSLWHKVWKATGHCSTLCSSWATALRFFTLQFLKKEPQKRNTLAKILKLWEELPIFSWVRAPSGGEYLYCGLASPSGRMLGSTVNPSRWNVFQDLSW